MAYSGRGGTPTAPSITYHRFGGWEGVLPTRIVFLPSTNHGLIAPFSKKHANLLCHKGLAFCPRNRSRRPVLRGWAVFHRAADVSHELVNRGVQSGLHTVLPPMRLPRIQNPRKSARSQARAPLARLKLCGTNTRVVACLAYPTIHGQECEATRSDRKPGMDGRGGNCAARRERLPIPPPRNGLPRA